MFLKLAQKCFEFEPQIYAVMTTDIQGMISLLSYYYFMRGK